MSEFEFPGTTNPEPISLSSSTDTMPPVIRKGLTREATENSIEGFVDIPKTKAPILSYTRCFIENSTTLTWQMIFKDFIKKEFLEDLENKEVYINVKLSKLYRLAKQYLVLTCVEVIGCMLQHIDPKTMIIKSENGQDLATYQPHDLHTYYNILKGNILI